MLDNVDIKPVTFFHVKDSRTGKIKKRRLNVLIDTGAQYSVATAEVAHYGKVRKPKHSVKFRTPQGTFESNRTTEMTFYLSEFSES